MTQSNHMSIVEKKLFSFPVSGQIEKNVIDDV